MTTEDLANYRAVHRTPLKTTWRGNFQSLLFRSPTDYTLYGMPMPGSGSATLTMALNMLEEISPQGTTLCDGSSDAYILAMNALR